MAKLKNTTLVKRGDILNSGHGITRDMLDKSVKAGVLKPVKIAGFGHNLYRRQDVIKVFSLTEAMPEQDVRT